jgi:hypothetical protein
MTQQKRSTRETFTLKTSRELETVKIIKEGTKIDILLKKHIF